MTEKEFLEKYPRPWTFETIDPSGNGVILDSNGELLAHLCTDIDWEDAEARRPVFNGDFDTEPRADERDMLVSILLGK